jgi:malonate transporter
MGLFAPLITIFIVIFLGIICKKKELFNKTQIDGLEFLLFKIIMPSYLFSVTYKNDLSSLLNGQYIASYLITFGILASIVMLFLIKRIATIAVYMRVLASGYVNAAIYTLPVITLLLKDPTAAVIGNIIQVILIQPLFIVCLNTLKNKDQSLSKQIFNILTAPLIMLPITGILLNYLQIEVPSPIVGAISQVGSGASSLGLFVFGLTLGATVITSKCLRFDLLSIVFSKNILHPLVAIGVGYFMGLEGYWLNSLVIAASAPTAFVVYLISKQVSTEEVLVKKTIALSSIVAMISLILITMVIG